MVATKKVVKVKLSFRQTLHGEVRKSLEQQGLRHLFSATQVNRLMRQNSDPNKIVETLKQNSVGMFIRPGIVGGWDEPRKLV